MSPDIHVRAVGMTGSRRVFGRAGVVRCNRSAVIGRAEHPFLVPDQPFEKEGEIPNVVFANGLVSFRGQWLLYYGAADKTIGICAARLDI